MASLRRHVAACLDNKLPSILCAYFVLHEAFSVQNTGRIRSIGLPILPLYVPYEYRQSADCERCTQFTVLPTVCTAFQG